NFETFNLGFTGQPIAHDNHIWNFLGMTLVGLCSAFLGGCPIRQTILASQGDSDAAVTVFGLIVGAAFAHNFGLAASGDGVPTNGKIAVIIGIVLVLAIAYSIVVGKSKAQSKSTVNKEVAENV